MLRYFQLLLLGTRINKTWVISILILLSNKYNVISYWNNTNNSNSDKNSGNDNNSNSDWDNKGDNYAKIIGI